MLTAPATKPDPSAPRRQIRTVLLYGLICAFAIGSVIAFRADFAKLSFAPLVQHPGALLAAVVLSLVNYVLRLWRWREYLSRLGCRTSLRYAGLAYIAGFAFTLSPGKAGELLRARYYAPLGVKVSSIAAACLAERLTDVISMMLMVLLSMTALSYHSFVGTLAAGIILLLVILVCAPWQGLLQWIERRQHWPRRIALAAAAVVATLSSAKALLGPRMLLLGVAIGTVAWGAEGLAMKVISDISAPDLIGWLDGVGIYSIAILVGAFSFLPGGLGGTEIVMVTLLSMRGMALPDALLTTLVCRILTLWFAVALGWLAVGALRRAHAPVASARLGIEP
jgi:glycosyltransferase 2 family protein